MQLGETADQAVPWQGILPGAPSRSSGRARPRGHGLQSGQREWSASGPGTAWRPQQRWRREPQPCYELSVYDGVDGRGQQLRVSQTRAGPSLLRTGVSPVLPRVALSRFH